jgi:hypothetical protein
MAMANPIPSMVQPQREQLASDLHEMKDAILQRGWCRGTFEDDDGRLCAIGAATLVIFTAGQMEPDQLGNIGYVTEVQRLRFRAVHESVSHFAALEAGEQCPSRPLSGYNDCASEKQVLGWIDKALAEVG